MVKPRTLRVCAVAAVLAAVYFSLYCTRLGQPGLLRDESYCRLETGITAADALMVSPYTGGLKAAAFLALSRLFSPDLLLLRWLSAAVGALMMAAVALLAGALAGEACALAAGLLMLADPSVFINVRYDFSGGPLAVLFLSLGALLLMRWEKSRSQALAACAGLCLGLALWCHLLAGLPVAAGLAALWLVRDGDWLKAARARRRGLAIALAGAAAGYLPALIWLSRHEWRRHPAWIAAGAGAWPARWAFHAAGLAAILDGRSAFGLLLPDGASWRSTWLGPLWLAAAAAQLAFFPVRRRGALLLMPVLSGAALCCVPYFYGMHHAFIALYPWLYLPMAVLTVDAAFSAQAPWKRVAAVVPVALCLLLSASATLSLRQDILADAVRPELSRQVQAGLADFLDSRKEQVIPFCFDFPDLAVLSGGRRTMDGSLAHWLWPRRPAAPGDEDWIASKLRAPDALYAGLADAADPEPGFKARFLREVRSQGLEPVIVERIVHARDGEPAVEIFRLARIPRAGAQSSRLSRTTSRTASGAAPK